MIAKVIVDVPVRQTNRTFDYVIPEKWEKVIEKGMRVIVPFGRRRVQGFVVDLQDSSQIKKLKRIEKLLDVSPVLTKELLALSVWLSEQTLCFTITALQAMLPVALKVNYKKVIELKQHAKLPRALKPLFLDRDHLAWEQVESNPEIEVSDIQAAIKAGAVEVIYDVKERKTKKTVTYVTPALDYEALRLHLDTIPPRANKQREIVQWFLHHYEKMPMSELLKKVNSTRSPVNALVTANVLTEKAVEVYRDPYAFHSFERSNPLPLTKMQQEAIQPIRTAIEAETYETILLHGVTGSGKTEIYLQAIQAVLNKGKEAIVLVPEISLTPQMVLRFKERFGTNVAVLHSALSTGEKYDEWRKVHRKEVKVVVGARSAIFAPFENIGIIIIDEEHESSYKQEENPRYHAREVAIWRSKYYDCPLVLGSATPTLESYARSKRDVYHLSELGERIHSQAMPTSEIVDMRAELREGNRTIFSRLLMQKIKDRLEKREQTVLFLNRRGYATFIICRDCGYVAECPHCDISLTFHKRYNTLKCHYCSYTIEAPSRCPECQSEYIRHFGTGTQKVESELLKVVPEARIIRMDVDTTTRKGSHEQLLGAFARQEGDILLGTQMIAKGLDFPNVTLVGVITADTMLNLPDFRAAERTFQLLTQVSGRAGRDKLAGEVVIQTYNPDHYSIQFASEHNFLAFYEEEMRLRRDHAYPPYYFLVLINVSHPNVTKAVAVTEKISDFLKTHLSSQAIILGPAASVIARIKDRYRYQCMVKYRKESNLLPTLQRIVGHYETDRDDQLQVTIDLNPQMLM